jgi:hypothetical protein
MLELAIPFDQTALETVRMAYLNDCLINLRVNSQMEKFSE